MLVKFLRRDTIRLDDGQLLIGQVDQQCDLEGEVLEAAIASGAVEPVETAASKKPAKAAAKSAAKAAKA